MTRGKKNQTTRYRLLGWLRSGTLRPPLFQRYLDVLVSQRCSSIKFNARVKGLRAGLRNNEVDRDLVRDLLVKDCHWCGTRIAGGIDRIDSRRSYVPRNLVPACTACNMAKGAMHPLHFVDVMHKIHIHHSTTTDSKGGQPNPNATWRRKERPQFPQWLRELAKGERERVQLSSAEFDSLIHQPCFFCGLPHAWGIDRSHDPAGPYATGNVRPACMVCNWTRRAMNTEVFLKMCHQVAQRNPAVGFRGETRVNGFLYDIQ